MKLWDKHVFQDTLELAPFLLFISVVIGLVVTIICLAWPYSGYIIAAFGLICTAAYFCLLLLKSREK